MVETTGWVMVNADAPDGETVTTAFLAMEQCGDGKMQPLSPKKAAKLKEMGFGPVGCVRMEVIRHGRKITYVPPYAFHFAEGLPPAFRKMLTVVITPTMVDEMLEEFFSEYNATKDKVVTA